MAGNDFHRDNHYVPRFYLKSWESSPKQVWTYRILVPHENVPPWKKHSTKGIAHHAHLYTRIAAGQESDEMERWLDKDFESPAEEPIQKAISDSRLTSEDWRRLIRFVAAQDVRTPSRLLKHLKHWQESMPKLLEETLQETVRVLTAAKARGEKVTAPVTNIPYADLFPVRVTTEIEPDQHVGILRAETVIGRGTWLFGIRHLLSKTADVLHQHKWTILTPPNGMTWFTSDNPVVKLNYNGPDCYDFGGGWGSKGTEILMPLSPSHLLYTRIGYRPPKRGSEVPRVVAEEMRRCIAENADRMIYAAEPDADVSRLRPRVVNAEYVRDEMEQWKSWHEEQTNAEMALSRLPKGNNGEQWGQALKV